MGRCLLTKWQDHGPCVRSQGHIPYRSARCARLRVYPNPVRVARLVTTVCCAAAAPRDDHGYDDLTMDLTIPVRRAREVGRPTPHRPRSHTFLIVICVCVENQPSQKNNSMSCESDDDWRSAIRRCVLCESDAPFVLENDLVVGRTDVPPPWCRPRCCSCPSQSVGI